MVSRIGRWEYRNLRLIDRHNCRQCADPQARNDTTDHHHGQPCCECLQGTAYEEYY